MSGKFIKFGGRIVNTKYVREIIRTKDDCLFSNYCSHRVQLNIPYPSWNKENYTIYEECKNEEDAEKRYLELENMLVKNNSDNKN
jgi:hypothetical protein